MVSLLIHICVTRPQWVNWDFVFVCMYIPPNQSRHYWILASQWWENLVITQQVLPCTSEHAMQMSKWYSGCHVIYLIYNVLWAPMLGYNALYMSVNWAGRYISFIWCLCCDLDFHAPWQFYSWWMDPYWSKNRKCKMTDVHWEHSLRPACNSSFAW